MTRSAYVYILASRRNGTLYTGVTSNLERRLDEHKHHLLEGFTRKYGVTRLVWFAQGEDIVSAIALEKKIKNRNRQWKIDLIEKNNPDWNDLAAGWMDSGPCDFAQGDSVIRAGQSGTVIPRRISESGSSAQGDDLARGTRQALSFRP